MEDRFPQYLVDFFAGFFGSKEKYPCVVWPWLLSIDFGDEANSPPSSLPVSARPCTIILAYSPTDNVVANHTAHGPSLRYNRSV